MNNREDLPLESTRPARVADAPGSWEGFYTAELTRWCGHVETQKVATQELVAWLKKGEGAVRCLDCIENKLWPA